MRASLRLAGALLMLCASRGGAEPLRVALTLTEPVGVGREAEPVTVGMPLPAGRVRAAEGLWIADVAGKAVATQARALERWPDGSLRWVLVDFLATVGARETATYTLRDGGTHAPAGPSVRTSETGTDRILDAGPLAFVVPAQGTDLVREARRGRTTIPARIPTPEPVVEGSDNRATRNGPTIVETAGPVRTEVLLRGRYPSDLAWEARLAVFAGLPWLRIQFTLTSLANRPYSRVRKCPLALDVGELGAAAFGLGAGIRRFEPVSSLHHLDQVDGQRVLLDGTPVDTTADGWVRGWSKTSVATIVRRFFHEEWPQWLAADAAGLSVDLLLGRDDPVELGMGAAKTFELWVVIEDAAHATDPVALAARLQHPLIAHPDPAWVVASRALPNALAPASPGARDLLPRLDRAIGTYLARNRAERWDDGLPVPCDQRTSERERVGAFGALNWGDWNFPGYRDKSEGCDAWGNLEYDLTQVLGLDWSATGWRPSWDAFIAAARHYRDVDVIHFAPGHEDVVGFNHPHKARHFAVESPNTIDLGHTWLEGLVTHYRLTGEVRSLEAARGIADVLVRRRHKAGNPRQYGWPMIALAGAYDATRDGRYRDAAVSYADAAVTAHQATPAAGDWKMGILSDGLAAVHAITGEERLREWLVRYADALVAEPDRFPDPRYVLPLGYLAVLTGNARYREVALARIERLDVGDWGKTLAISGRTAFRVLGPIAAGSPKAAPTPARAAPPRPSAPARRRR